ncbi:hypothetical protein D9M70_590720 [compost metagenome]
MLNSCISAPSFFNTKRTVSPGLTSIDFWLKLMSSSLMNTVRVEGEAWACRGALDSVPAATAKPCVAVPKNNAAINIVGLKLFMMRPLRIG